MPKQPPAVARIYPTCVACAAAGWDAPDEGMASFIALLARGAPVAMIVLDMCEQHRDLMRQVVASLEEDAGGD